ncbi:hypothetical protein KJ980_04775 [Patescibacteria group bacterium]|nr:hypothetical protein [Patescibacteria group bacterium]
MLNQKKRVCIQCGFKLIVISRVTGRVDGSLFPQTTTIFRCSNEGCQEKKDKEAERRAEANDIKAKADEKRKTARETSGKKAKEFSRKKA